MEIICISDFWYELPVKDKYLHYEKSDGQYSGMNGIKILT